MVKAEQAVLAEQLSKAAPRTLSALRLAKAGRMTAQSFPGRILWGIPWEQAKWVGGLRCTAFPSLQA